MAKRKPTMTVEGMKARIKAIKEKAKVDFESAHSDEIDLYKDVLKQIANHGPWATGANLVECQLATDLAKEALKAGKLKFTRNTT